MNVIEQTSHTETQVKGILHPNDIKPYYLESEDEILIEEIKKGNKKAFEKLFYYYFPRLTSFAEGILFDSQAAQDIVQNLFIKFWENAHEIKINSSAKAYLFTAVRNRCFNRIKSLKVQDKKNLLYLEGLLNSNNLVDLEDDPQNDAILKALNTLPKKMLEIFRMKYFSNRNIKDISKALGISENTVKTHLLRGKNKLRQSLCSYSS